MNQALDQIRMLRFLYAQRASDDLLVRLDTMKNAVKKYGKLNQFYSLCVRRYLLVVRITRLQFMQKQEDIEQIAKEIDTIQDQLDGIEDKAVLKAVREFLSLLDDLHVLFMQQLMIALKDFEESDISSEEANQAISMQIESYQRSMEGINSYLGGGN